MKRIVTTISLMFFTFSIAEAQQINISLNEFKTQNPDLEHFHSIDDHHYFLKDELMSWIDAKNYGDQIGVSMYIINSSDEENEVYANLPLTGNNGFGYLIGLYQDINDPGHSEPNGGWKWVDGTSLTYSNWETNEPNNANNGEDYGQFDWQGGGTKWNDIASSPDVNKPIYEFVGSSADILLNGTVSAENNQIKNVADPTDAQDAATKSYIDSLIANLQSQIDQINSTQPQYDLTEGLVGYYPFNGNANDASGNGKNGTVSGATLTANKDGDVNSAYSFDGDQDIITISNDDQINNPQITISAMIRPTRYTALEQDQGDNQQVIVSNAPQDGWGSGFEFKTFGETDNNGNQYLSLGVTGTVNGNFSSQTDNIGMSLNQWSHVVYTHDDNNIKFYLNGQLVLSEDSPGTNFYNQNPISIGSRPSIRHVFSGGIDDVGIWNKILTAEEIEYLYSNPNFLE